MPQLQTFALAEKGLLTREGTVSLIVILQRMEISVKAAHDPRALPKNAVAPMTWCAYTLWHEQDQEHGVEFTNVIKVSWPDKSEFLTTSSKFSFTETKTHSVLQNVIGFPVGQQGEVVVDMWLERDHRRIGEVHSWKVEIVHKAEEPAQREAQTIH